MRLTLVRQQTIMDALFGTLTAGLLSFATLEPRDEHVPAGLYTLEPHDGERFHNVFCLVNEELGVYHWPHVSANWSTILIHNGNVRRDSNGCLLIGRVHGSLYEGEPAVLQSIDALNALRALLHSSKEQHTLEIRE